VAHLLIYRTLYMGMSVMLQLGAFVAAVAPLLHTHGTSVAARSLTRRWSTTAAVVAATASVVAQRTRERAMTAATMMAAMAMMAAAVVMAMVMAMTMAMMAMVATMDTMQPRPS
jgi:hypothetical protein